MKKYILIVSQVFPGTHPRKGWLTLFGPKILNSKKKHTIRENYALWKKRIDEVNAGKAVISVRYWTGRPYYSPQNFLFNIYAGQVGIEKCSVYMNDDKPGLPSISIGSDDITKGILTDNETLKVIENDGISVQDFIDWFKKPVHNGCIIHFTNLRYGKV